MTAEIRPLSQLVSQGWEVLSYSCTYDHMRTAQIDCFLLRRQKQHKVLKVRSKNFGAGYAIREIDL